MNLLWKWQTSSVNTYPPYCFSPEATQIVPIRDHAIISIRPGGLLRTNFLKPILEFENLGLIL